MDWLKPMGDEIIRALQIKPTDTVLDIAAGTGEPGLTIAALASRGKVVITDLAEGMLDVARDKARQKGVTNYETVVCDVSELPFDDATFDAVSCRFGFIFFPDMLLAAKEMARVLKPGGKIAAAVWGVPDKNVWVTAIMGTIQKNISLPAPAAGALGMFRCGSPGFLADIFKQAGFKHVSEKEITVKLTCGDNERYWNFMNEVAAPVVAAVSKADTATTEKIKQQVYELVDQKYLYKKAALDYGAVVVSGEK
ncbi:class I SAM-dependent methyltransferase [Hymenobacter sp. BT188]|uniref:class I SAM-dependent methyltransferase n=1 Tax=Hymenobacter sp. BT188 TaxID=2763504 RepID=UPI0021C9D563|nr:class I SAM-dependent methyltransferase [Hymenobacter sp. BT188]